LDLWSHSTPSFRQFLIDIMSFYFPSTWQRYRLWILLPTYLLGFVLASLILFTNLVIAGPLYRNAPHITDPMPGPLMLVSAALFMLQVLGGAVGLFIGFSVTPFASLRKQTFALLIPTALVTVAALIHWIDVLSRGSVLIPHEFTDTLLLLAASLYARAIVRYGSFVGHPLMRRDLFYSMLAVTIGLTLLYLTLTLDQWLMKFTHFPYPPATGILVLVLVIAYPAIKDWIMRKMDARLFQIERRQQELVYHLVDALSDTPDPEYLRIQLLDALCAVLDVQQGFIALPVPELPADILVIQAIHGNLALKPGDRIRCPPLNYSRQEPQLINALPEIQAESVWKDIVLLCPLITGQTLDGIMALGEKRDATPYKLQEMALCAELAKQLTNVQQMMRIKIQRTHHLEVIHSQSQSLRQLGGTVINSTQRALASWKQTAAPIQIRVLGPMQLRRNGQIVSEAEWGSEKAKLLLAYLLWKSPQGVIREELSQALWPERPFEQTANVFHVTLHRLRRVLQPQIGSKIISNYVVHDRGHYRFNTEAPHWLDVTEFEKLISQTNPMAYRTAIELYRGSYLADTAWVLPPDVEARQRRLEQAYADALRRLIVQLDGREAITYLEKLLIVEPADETAYHALISGYLAQGRRDLAIRYVTRWQQALEELDLDPTPEVESLWQMVNSKSKI